MSDTKKATRPNVGTDRTNGSRVILWQRGLYVFAIAIGIAMVLANVSLWLRGGFSRLLLAAGLIIVGMCWLVLKSVRGGFVEPSGIKVAAAEPKLAEFVNHIAATVQARQPDEIYLSANPQLRVVESSQNFGLKSDKCVLAIGMPLIQTLTQAELASAIAHQMAHYADGDVGEGARAFRGLEFAAKLIAVERQGTVNGVFGSYGRKMFRSVGGVGVAQEEAADRIVVDAYGTKASLSALAKFDQVISMWDELLREYVVPALQVELHPTPLHEGLAEMLAAPERVEALAADVARRQQKERTEFSLHRTATERTALINSWDHVNGSETVSDASAVELLDADAASAEIAVAAWAQKLIGERTEPRPWQELAADVFSAAHETTAHLPFEAEDIEVASAGERLDVALEWATSEDWTRVHAELDKKLKSVADPGQRLADWATSVVTDAAAESDKFSWKHTFAGPPLLVDDDGVEFPAPEIATLLIDGDADAARAAFDRATA